MPTITPYLYSVANDTANGKVSDTLLVEIGSSSILYALNSLTVSADVLTISFQDALSAGDKTILDGIVLSHAGIELEPSPEVVELSNLDPDGNMPVAADKPVGASMSVVSHDFCKETSWFERSTRITGEALANPVGLVYTAANNRWIDLQSGDVPKEDSFSGPYLAKVYEDGAEITQGFTIDYFNGKVTFDSAPSGAITVDYSHAGNSTWAMKPGAGERYKLGHAELDFTVDVVMSKVHFDVWVYNPFVDLQSPIDPDSPTWAPGDAGNPLRFLYERVTYKNYKDILKIANTVEVIEPLPGITNRTLRAVFDYGKSIDLRDSQGAELRITIDDDAPFVGEFGSVTFYIIPESEVV